MHTAYKCIYAHLIFMQALHSSFHMSHIYMLIKYICICTQHKYIHVLQLHTYFTTYMNPCYCLANAADVNVFKLFQCMFCSSGFSGQPYNCPYRCPAVALQSTPPWSPLGLQYDLRRHYWSMPSHIMPQVAMSGEWLAICTLVWLFCDVGTLKVWIFRPPIRFWPL